MSIPDIRHRLCEVESNIQAFNRQIEYLQLEEFSLRNELNTKMYNWQTKTQTEDQELDDLEEAQYREQVEKEREQAEKERAEYDYYESKW
jgi:hypothetical protein